MSAEKETTKSRNGMKNGLYHKYFVSKMDGGVPDPKADYFVLRIDKDPAARKALAEYAKNISNKELAKDITNKLTEYNDPQTELKNNYLTQDNDCHWYVIQEGQEEAFKKWCKDIYSEDNHPHDFADNMIGGCPSLVRFGDYEC